MTSVCSTTFSTQSMGLNSTADVGRRAQLRTPIPRDEGFPQIGFDSLPPGLRIDGYARHVESDRLPLPSETDCRAVASTRLAAVLGMTQRPS